MKKETIFRHELNESIQATAALNCLKNRNKHQQNEGFLMTAGIWVLKKIVFHLVMKAIKKYGSQIDFSKVMDSVANGLAEQKGALQKAIGKAVNGWNDLPEKYKNQITELAKEKFNELKSAAGEKINQLTSKGQPQLANQEQEEEDYTNDEIPSPNFSYRMSFMVWAMREIIPYLKEISQVCAQADPTELKHAVMKILKTRDTGIPETPRSCREWAKRNYDWVEMDLNGEYDAYQEKYSKPFNIPASIEETPYTPSEQEEDTLNAYYSQDEPDYENDHHGIWLIINLMRKKGMLRAQGIEGRDDVDDGHAIDAAYDLIEQKLNDEGMWIGDDDHEAERFVSFFGEEIAEEAMKSAIHNQEQEEMPQMERHDIILALTQYLDESWIDADEDGDLDELYYAVAEVLDKTGDYPASTDWEDCKPWCQKHYREVEETFLGGGF